MVPAQEVERRGSSDMVFHVKEQICTILVVTRVLALTGVKIDNKYYHDFLDKKVVD
jgi:hypothetical protein